MEMIAAKTPEMVLKDIWMHLLAYNLLRTLMWQSPQHAQVSPLRLSLQGKAGFRGEASPRNTAPRQQFNQFRPQFAQASERERQRLYVTLLAVIHELLVPLRRNRVEPRVVKRRPKPFPRMQQPRSAFKAKLAA